MKPALRPFNAARIEQPNNNMSEEVKSKEGEPIRERDEVMTKIRGGVHKGEASSRTLPSIAISLTRCVQVDKIVTSEEEAEEAGVKNLPKVRLATLRRRCQADGDQVLFRSFNQTHPDGKDVAHNPSTLSKES